MQKKIKFNGLANVPSDRECPDGQLAMAINLVNDNSGLEPAQAPETVFTIQGDARGMTVKGTHVVAGQKMYILANENNIGYYDPDFVYHEIVSGIEDIQFIKPMGNALVVGTESDLLYAIYKDGGYTWLGAMPGLVDLSFGLEGYWHNSGGNQYFTGFSGVKGAENEFGEYDITYSEDDQQNINNAVMGVVNEYLQQLKEDNLFIAPFFVRYAYRLYDGTHIKHSAPILMVPCSGAVPFIFAGALSISGFGIRAQAYACNLNYALVSAKDDLERWEDIIKGVDIFVSQPLMRYDQSGDVLGGSLKLINRFDDYECFGKAFDTYHIHTYADFIRTMLPASDYISFMNIPTKADDLFIEEIKNTGLFYKIAEISISDLSESRLSLAARMSSDALINLTQKEVLQDEYLSNHKTVGLYGYVYNSRLSVANLNQDIFNGHSYQASTLYLGNISWKGWIYYYLKKEGRTVIVKTEETNARIGPMFLYYPDSDAYKALVVVENSSGVKSYITVDLLTHPALNGAYYYGGLESPTLSELTPGIEPVASSDKNVSLPSKIITSDPLNPFFWPVEGVNTVGSGSILGMASATKALSQGQFGQFPLYVFTSEGVWAMQVSNTGLFSSVHPVTRDILSTPGKVLQMDNDIAFMTKKGIMVLGGSESVCITDILGSKEAFRRNTMSSIDNLVYNLGVNIYPASGINTLIKGMFYGLSDILLTGILAYDYTNEKIYAFIPGTPYAFIFNKRSKEWTTAAMSSNVLGVFSDYPDCLVMLQNYKVVNISTKKETSDQQYFALITRPIKLAESGSEALKKITRLIVRGTFAPEPGAYTLPTVCCALYGTMDYKTYAPVASSINHVISSIRGKHYKAFRAVVVGRLFQGESLSGMDVDYEIKPADKIE